MNSTTTSSSALAAELRSSGFTGRLLEAGDPDYEGGRAVFNGAVDRYPAAIALAKDADDVAASIRAARVCGRPFTVRGGGHSIPGRSIADDALCIDLRGINSVRVDGGSGRVAAGGGALLSELDAASQEHGLAVPAGQISHTGIGGLTLGGGVGWLMRRYGLTIDALRGAEVVLADGSIVEAGPESDPELFWALRGGGGDFGVVTRFDYQAHPVGPIVLGGMRAYPWQQAQDVFAAARELIGRAPRELTLFAVLLTAPPAPPFPPELQGRKVVVLSAAWCGDLGEGERLLASLDLPAPALDLIGPMPYVALQSMLDETAPRGWGYYDRQHYLPEVSDGFVDDLLDGFERVPTPQSHVMTAWMGGAIDDVADGETAFGHRGAGALSWIIGCSGTEPIDGARAWVRDVWEQTSGHAAGGVYVNALDPGRSIRDAYEPGVYERLVSIKRRLDPDGVFAGNGIG